MGVETGSTQVNAGLEYQEKTKSKENNKTEVTISVVFSPYTYDFLKKYSNWNYAPTEYFDKYVYLRFMNKLQWSTKSALIKEGPEEISIDDVPINARLSGPDADHLTTVFDKYIFIDCTTKEGGKDIVKLDWDSMIGYLSFAISEVKDCLFRLHKYDYYGDVKFVVTGYEPLEPLLQTFCLLIGERVRKSKYDFSSFANAVKGESWFGNFKPWLDKYKWTPHLEECALFEGCFYGASEETIASKAMKQRPVFLAAEKQLRPYWRGGNGIGGQVVLDDAWIINWKENGGASTDRGAYGPNKPIYYFDNAPFKGKHNGKGMTSAWNLTDGDEEPLAYINDYFYTLRELREAIDRLEILMSTDQMGPKWWIGRAPRGGKRMRAEDQLDFQADAMQKDLESWLRNTYQPQKSEYEQQLAYIDARHKNNSKYNAKEEEVWERKAAEDEGVSAQWNAGIDDVPYHGKSVNRSYFTNELQKLEKEKQEREHQIKKCRNNSLLIKALKICSLIQFTLGIVSLGATSSLAVASLLIIDSVAETTKVVFQFVLDDDYTLGKAMEEHLLTYMCNAVSGLLLHAPFKQYTSAEKNTLNSMKSPSTMAPPAPLATTTAENTAKAGTTLTITQKMYNYTSNVVNKGKGAAVATKGAVVKFFPKQAKAFTDWLGNMKYAVKNNSAKGAYHFLGGAAQTATFVYTGYSAYSNALFVFNRQELSQEEIKQLKIKTVDSEKAENVFPPRKTDAIQPVPQNGGVDVSKAIGDILKKDKLDT